MPLTSPSFSSLKCLASIIHIATATWTFPEVEVADYSSLTGLPKLEHKGRVLDLVNGEHFDDVLKDTPEEMLPPSIILFHGFESCPTAVDDFDYKYIATSVLPARERLTIAMYDMDRAPRLNWHKWAPERDLAARFNVTTCPTLVYAPRCTGLTEWCETKSKADPLYSIAGCEDFTESCDPVSHWNAEEGETWQAWVQQKLEAQPWPKLNLAFDSYNFQGRYIQSRSDVTTNTWLRNLFMAQAMPAFTQEGVKAVVTPPEVQEFLVDVYKNYNTRARPEIMSFSETQNSHFATTARMIDVHSDRRARQMCNTYLKPLVSSWSGIPESDLTMTSFYGIREYQTGHFLRNHIDRLDTHVLSLTISVAKLDESGTISASHYDPEQNRTAWPLEYVNYAGDNVRYQHPPGMTVLYESAKVPHGRPQRQPADAGLHLGAFVHYSPSQRILDWKSTVNEARKIVWKHVAVVAYASTRSVEPPNPVRTSRAYSDIGTDDVTADTRSKQQQVDFYNLSDRPLSLFWISDDEAYVVNCNKVLPKKSCNIGTHPGHNFIWGEFGDTKNPVILEDSRTVIKAKQRSYLYPKNAKRSKDEL